ncbi:DUF4325 domain-containing protein [Brachyspira aalborgi]|uniref:DUF4325 domain-containing protein n=1 Tax=Brachyspira aalborgi TaxID=29522 RepID=A0A5C8F898_9SPIR|nr:STAS-like domain-containing protein [Brachyspira aalborgi]TXJ45634.1 DUF4325 domain-containing protein [Brachyspira aalborgi]
MKNKIINLSKDYNNAPAGRYCTDSDYSGEHFRKELLIPALKENDTVTIILDDLDGIGSSFWDEAFGGLVRDGKFSKEDLNKKLILKCDDDIYLVGYIKSFINEAYSINKNRVIK